MSQNIAFESALEIEFCSPQEWDATAHEFDDICQEQLHVYAIDRWPHMEMDCLFFMKDGQRVAGCLMMYRTAPMGFGGLAVCKWGPALKDMNAPDAEQLHAHVIDALTQHYAVERRMMLSILSRPRPAEENFAAKQLLEKGFKPGMALPFPDRYFVNVHISEDEMRKSFGQKWRSHLKKSEKEGLVFEHCPIEKMQVFYDLYKAMTERKQFPDYSAYDSLHNMMDNIDPSIRPELFLVYHEGEPVAGAVIFTGGDTAVYLYGATNDKALPLRAGYFMHWEIMKWLAQKPRIKWYDLGGTDGFLGLHQFKNGMVGKAGAVAPVPRVKNYAHWILPKIMGNSLFMARDLRAHIVRRIKGVNTSGENQ